jgi:NAD-dependent dihydropyrimidine dehydrogenase PreA subunit
MDTARIRDVLSGRARRHNTLLYNAARCVGCGLCSQVCPHGVFSAPELAPMTAAAVAEPRAGLLGARTARRKPVARLMHPENCMECGACQLNCPSGAIKVDSGVGCATAMIYAALRGSQEVTCGSDCCGMELSSRPVEGAKRRQAEC